MAGWLIVISAVGTFIGRSLHGGVKNVRKYRRYNFLLRPRTFYLRAVFSNVRYNIIAFGLKKTIVPPVDENHN